MAKRKRQRPTVLAGRALEQLARRLTLRQAIPTSSPADVDVLPLIEGAALADGWLPPRGLFLDKRTATQTIRRCAVAAILDNAPLKYQQHPRALDTFDWVRDQLETLSPVLGEKFSHETLVKDIEDWAYSPVTGRRKKK